MPPVDRLKPIRAASSESGYTLLEFMREWPDDETCLQVPLAHALLARWRDGVLPKVRAGEAVQALRVRHAPSVVDLHRVRPPRHADGRDDL